MSRIAVVDDEAEIRELLVEYLSAHGFDVFGAEGAAAFDQLLADQDIDVALLDVAMPGEDGFSLARRLRATSDMGIIMVTSAEDVFDRVVGLEMGADDYITKPFDLGELRMRIESVLRRSGRLTSGNAEGGGTVSLGGRTYDADRGVISSDSGEEIELSEGDRHLLDILLARRNTVLTRSELLDLLEIGADDAFDRTIDVRVTRLRRKIEVDPSKPQVLKTIRGAGYKLVLGE